MISYLRNKLSFKTRINILVGVIFIPLLILFFIPRIPQPLSYHNFADQRMFFDIPNCWNVLSNLAFLIPGLIGIGVLLIKRLPQSFAAPCEKLPFFVLFIGAILVAFGSGYYHLDPNNQNLLWDRLSIGVVQSSIMCIMLSDRFGERVGVYFLSPIIALALLAGGYWEYTEIIGQGDLRFYGWCQSMSVVVILLLLILFPSRYTGLRYIMEALTLYAAGRAGEILDNPIYYVAHQVISGHTIKHLAMGAAVYALLRYMLYRRIIISEPLYQGSWTYRIGRS